MSDAMKRYLPVAGLLSFSFVMAFWTVTKAAEESSPKAYAYPRTLIYIAIVGAVIVAAFVTYRILKKKMTVPVLSCSRCGVKNKEGSKFCEWCGNVLSEEDLVKFDPSRIIMEVIGAVVVIISLYVIFFGIEAIPTAEPFPLPGGVTVSTAVPTTVPSPPSYPPAMTPTRIPPSSAPPSTSLPPSPAPVPSSPAPPESTVEGEIENAVGDGRIRVYIYSVFRSDYGGYWIEVVFENVTEKAIQWNPVEISMIDTGGYSHECRFEEPYSYIKSGFRYPREGFKDYFAIPQIVESKETFRLVLEFPAGRHLPQVFVLTNEYDDGARTRWEIRVRI